MTLLDLLAQAEEIATTIDDTTKELRLEIPKIDIISKSGDCNFSFDKIVLDGFINKEYSFKDVSINTNDKIQKKYDKI